MSKNFKKLLELCLDKENISEVDRKVEGDFFNNIKKRNNDKYVIEYDENRRIMRVAIRPDSAIMRLPANKESLSYLEKKLKTEEKNI